MLRLVRPGRGARWAEIVASRRSLRMMSSISMTSCGLHVDRALPVSFSKILIANRGEIAVRVIRTAKELGIKTVAVYSEADANSLHVNMADEAVCIGPPTAAQSYLLSDRILEVCKETGAQAVHPGYGFLSENAEFAEACAQAGIVFIGPPADAIRSMGSKSASKKIMIDAKVPVVPGYHGEDQSLAKLQEEADKVGFPLMIKAVLGGGGKGMRVVKTREEFDDMLDACKRESMKSFKDDRVLLERYIERPRHIEFQVFGDTHGNAVHLHERDCSVQRRHQKVLEEAPAPGMSSELRKEMGTSAVNAAKAVGYVGAGTVEFIFDAETDDYFFMEMNTRLQVEHPVTEMVMKRDLVQWQFHVAAGHTIPAKQDELEATDHALEARIYAENPQNNFLPATGELVHLEAPALAPDCRVETGVRQGDEVSIYYDPMISKLIVTGQDRPAALKRMLQALDDYHIAGPPTNIEFLKKAVAHPAFMEGMVETGFIEQHMDNLVPPVSRPATHREITLATLSLLSSEAEYAEEQAHPEDDCSPWSANDNFRVNVPAVRTLSFHPLDALGESTGALNVQVEYTSDGYTLTFEDGKKGDVNSIKDEGVGGVLTCVLDGVKCVGSVAHDDDTIHVFADGSHFKLAVPRASFGAATGKADAGCTAPMAGKVVKVAVSAGGAVKQGEPVMIMEAMKMEHVIKAPRDGVVDSVLFQVGDFVDGGKVVVSLVEEAEDE